MDMKKRSFKKLITLSLTLAMLKCRDKSGHTGIRCAVSSEGEG